MFLFVWLGIPFLIALVLAAKLATSWLRACALLGIGLLLGSAIVLDAYFSAPTDALHDAFNCSHCQQFAGRYWEPAFVLTTVGIGCLAWAAGIAVGGLARHLLIPAPKPNR